MLCNGWIAKPLFVFLVVICPPAPPRFIKNHFKSVDCTLRSFNKDYQELAARKFLYFMRIVKKGGTYFR